MNNIENEIEEFEEAKSKVTAMPIKNFKLTEKGGIKANSIYNAGVVFQRDPLLAGKFAFNEFSYEIELLKTIPELMIEAGNPDDDYTPALQNYIEEKYGVLFNDKLINGALTNVARKNVFNPVLDYFEKCEANWDGKTRSDTFLPDYLGVEPGEVTTLQTQLFFVGAVAKTYKPEMKFDYVLDLVGGQGAGKTTLLKNISNGWYTDQFTDFENKDNYGNMLRALIVNDDEMTATANSSFEILKKFISSETLEYRKPYGRTTIRRNKNFVMARTTNEVTYLKDRTGERRFMPVLVNKQRQTKSPITELTPDYIAQLWGEFTSLYHHGFNFQLTDEQEQMLTDNRDKFAYVDAQEDAIEECLAGWHGDFITSKDISMHIGEENLVKNRKLAQKIKYVMDNHKAWKSGTKRIGGIPKKGYWRT